MQVTPEKPQNLEGTAGNGSRWFTTTHKARNLGMPDAKLHSTIDITTGRCLHISMFLLQDRNAEFNALIALGKRFGPPDVLTTDARELQGTLALTNGQWGNVAEVVYFGGAAGEISVSACFRKFADFLNCPQYKPELPLPELNHLFEDWRHRYNETLG
jgi:hypothetical protein